MLLSVRQVSFISFSLLVCARPSFFLSASFTMHSSVSNLLCFNHSAAMGSRRQNLIRWTPYMDECLLNLENSPQSLPSDKNFCQWVKLQRLADELGTQLSTDDISHIDITDQKTQYALKGFERQMNEWEKQKTTEITSRMFSHQLERRPISRSMRH